MREVFFCIRNSLKGQFESWNLIGAPHVLPDHRWACTLNQQQFPQFRELVLSQYTPEHAATNTFPISLGQDKATISAHSWESSGILFFCGIIRNPALLLENHQDSRRLKESSGLRLFLGTRQRSCSFSESSGFPLFLENHQRAFHLLLKYSINLQVFQNPQEIRWRKAYALETEREWYKKERQREKFRCVQLGSADLSVN